METQMGARPGAERRLFEFLAATRPERAGGGRVAAVVASVTVHAAILTLAIWGTAYGNPWANRQPERAREYMVDLLPPAELARERDAASGSAMASARHTARDAGSDVLVERALAVAPPVIAVEPITAPPVVFASLERSEYWGIGSDSMYTAGQIVGDHHDLSADELAAAPPRFTSFTEPPQLTNTEFVRKRLTREYPPFLQDQGVGGRVVLWFLVDETGQVKKWLMKESSGHPALDRVAMKVAALMRFRPALNYDRHVAVWVALPVFFQVVEEAS